MTSLVHENSQVQNLDNSPTSNLTFIDTNLTNYQSLIPDTNDNVVILIDSGQNGIEQITEALEQYSNLDSISIFSHGDVGLLQLGNTYLSNNNLDNYQADLTTWGNVLSETGDLLFYGCNVGANNEGLAFVDLVGEITGADVAASNDLTGNFELGGDWDLEVVTGEIETQTFVVNEYGSLLAISQQDLTRGITADFNGDGLADILRQEKGSWDDDNNDNVQLLISNGSGFSEYGLSAEMNSSLKGDLTDIHLGDFNGDGKTDFISQGNNFDHKGYLWLSTGTNFTKIDINSHTYRNEMMTYQNESYQLHVGDFNGDGKSDVLSRLKYSEFSFDSRLFISTGNGFNWYDLGTEMESYLQGGFTNLYVGDFNGDGKDDLLRQEKGTADDDSSGTADLLISTGNNFNKVALPESLYIKGDRTKLYVGDFNGDGKSDILGQEKGTWDTNNSYWDARLLISNGNGFSKYSLGSLNSSLKADFTNLYLADYNGDGKDDILRQEKGRWDNDNVNTANLLISGGTYFTKYNLSESFDLEGDYTNLYTGDFNGDGKSDLIRQEKDARNDNSADLLISSGTNFSKTTLPYYYWLNGDQTNLFTNNLNSHHSIYNDHDNNGLKFNFSYDDGIDIYGTMTSFELAGRIWSEYFTDDVTINIHIATAAPEELPNMMLGGAVPAFYQDTSYTDFKNRLSDEVDVKSGNYDDQTAVNNLDSGSTYQMSTPSNSSSGVSREFDKVAMTRANAKALGFVDSNDSILDGTIVMNNLANTGVVWRSGYDAVYTDMADMNSPALDLVTVAMHEIGHIMGFVSLVDGLSSDNYQDYSELNNSTTALDLFRFRDENTRSIRTGNAYFSIDGGATDLARNSRGVNNIGGDTGADGFQGSHWKNEDNAGIMDPLLDIGIERSVTELDLRAFDVIGWDRKFAPTSSKVELYEDSYRKTWYVNFSNLNAEIDGMMNDWRWARRGSESRLRQDGNIAQFLAQEGFFNVGAFRESFDFSTVKSVADPTISNRDFLIVLDNQFKPQEFPTNDNNDSDSTSSSEIISDTSIADVVVENEGISYEQMLALVTEGLSDYELSQLSLDDLAKLIEQQLAESLVPSLS